MYLWHGGATVKYHVLDPTTGDYECILLGPNLEEGNVMQVCSAYNKRGGSQTRLIPVLVGYVTHFMGKNRLIIMLS